MVTYGVDKSDLPDTLKKWYDHEFSSGGTTGPDYKSFQRSYVNWLKKELSGYDVSVNKMHYEMSAVITLSGDTVNPDKYVYLSFSDVRFFPCEWCNHILLRRMKHERDWSGGINRFCNITQVREAVDALMAL